MKTNKVEHCRWCLWNKSRLQIFRIRNRRRRIRRISRQNKYRKKFSRIFLQWYRSNDITTSVLSRPIYFLSQKNCNDEEDWPVNGRTSTVCLKNISVLDVCTENGTREEKEKVTRKSWIFSPFAFRLLPSTFRFDSLFLFLSFFLERKESREPIECLVTVFKVRAEFRRLLRGQNGRMFGIEIDPVFPRYTQNKFYVLDDQRQDYIRIQDLKRYRNENYFTSSENVFEYNCTRTASLSKGKFFCSRDSKKTIKWRVIELGSN